MSGKREPPRATEPYRDQYAKELVEHHPEAKQAMSGEPEVREKLDRYCSLRHQWLTLGDQSESNAGDREALEREIIAALASRVPAQEKPDET